MSQNSLIYCKPVAELERYWQFLGQEGQLFYDYRHNLFTFRNGTEFWTVTMKDNVPLPDMKYQVNNVDTILALAYSKTKKYVVIQTTVSTLRVINLETKQEQKIALKSWDKMITIILFDWLWNCPGVDFFIVDAFSIRMYKLDEDKNQLKELGTQSMDSHYAWFEPKSEVLVVAQTSGAFQTIFFESYAKTKKIKGPNFNIDLRTDVEVQNAGMSPASKSPKHAFYAQQSLRNRNVLYNSLMDQNLDYHRQKISLVSMYGLPSLIHININFGKVFIYFITNEKVTTYPSTFTLPCESIYSVSLVDNLVLVNNISENISFLYDIRKSNPIQTVGSPQSLPLIRASTFQGRSDKPKMPSTIPHLPEVGQSTTDQEERKDNVSSNTIEETLESINGRIIDEDRSPKNNESEVSKQLDISQNLDASGLSSYTQSEIRLFAMEQNPLYLTSTKFLDYAYFIDVKGRQVIRYEIESKHITKLLDDKIDALFFLVRRTDCKDLALDFLKQIILKKEELMMLSFVFNKFAEVYKKAHDEREMYKDLTAIEVRRQSSFGPSSSRYLQQSTLMSSSTLGPQQITSVLRTSSNYNVIVQSDLHSKIFGPLAEDKDFDQEYLTQLLLEYFRVSMENGIQILDETQAIFFKLILINQKFSLLQFLLQFHCLHDSYELAEVLIKLGMKDKTKFKGNKDSVFTRYIKDEYFPEMFQLGLDMMVRLERIKDVIEHLLAEGKVLDAMELAKRKNFQGINPRWFLEAAVKEGSQCSVGDVISFILNNVRRGRSEEKCLFEQDVTEIIKSFQNSLNQ